MTTWRRAAILLRHLGGSVGSDANDTKQDAAGDDQRLVGRPGLEPGTNGL